jgi:large subunit ribosomal protein L13
MKTYSPSAKEIEPHWHVLDAEGRPLGRLASEIAQILRGKHRPTFAPHMDSRDYVVVVNASRVRITGKKTEQKTYYRHTGYPGGLRETAMGKLLDKHPDRVVQTAVKGMLPHNRLGRQLLGHLKIYGGPDHPHEAQVNAGSRKAKATTVATKEPA